MSESQQKQLLAFREGVYLETSSGQTIDELRDQACADRIALAEHFLAAGDKMMRSRPPEYRSAISRFYYSMYHAMRAVAFYAHGGDDHQEHRILPQKTPSDFPSSAQRENDLKDARTTRNSADYDPYPSDITAHRAAAKRLQPLAQSLIPDVRTYLKSKGCTRL